MASFRYLTADELEQGLAHVLQSPENNGSLELIIKRPEVDQRVSVTEGRLEIEHGLVGDSWRGRGGDMTDGSAVSWPGLKWRKPAAGNKTCYWRCNHRGHGTAAHGLQKVCGPIW